MALIDKIPKPIARVLHLSQRDPARNQVKVLGKLLRKARFTEFGQHYRFDEILLNKQIAEAFQRQVPIHDYNSIYRQWWHKTLEGFPDVCWPGKIKYFALSSGTSEAASKYIPVTNDLISGNKAIMVRQLLSLRKYNNIPFGNIPRGWLSLGGSTTLQKGNGYFAGDLSGITAKNSLSGFSLFTNPAKKIAREQDWQRKLEEIVEKAPSWDISFMLGVPAWAQLCMEMIIERYNLKTIHDIWPNLSFFVHGGVAFEPYKKGFEKYLARPLTYINTYLASEGFIAYQHYQGVESMRLVTNNHIFHEFVEFSEKNFDADGNIKPDAKALMVQEVEEGKDYALLISTVAGAWRYLLGDTIRFVNKEKCEIIITGRTKFFLSMVGEHLSVENMNSAIRQAQEHFNISIPEFTVAGMPFNNFFAHRWYVATSDAVNVPALQHFIDERLKELNDDYAVERRHALREMTLEVLTPHRFMDFMASKGKVGGQHKFPRVLKGKMLEDWIRFLEVGNRQPTFVSH